MRKSRLREKLFDGPNEKETLTRMEEAVIVYGERPHLSSFAHNSMRRAVAAASTTQKKKLRL